MQRQKMHGRSPVQRSQQSFLGKTQSLSSTEDVLASFGVTKYKQHALNKQLRASRNPPRSRGARRGGGSSTGSDGVTSTPSKGGAVARTSKNSGDGHGDATQTLTGAERGEDTRAPLEQQYFVATPAAHDVMAKRRRKHAIQKKEGKAATLGSTRGLSSAGATATHTLTAATSPRPPSTHTTDLRMGKMTGPLSSPSKWLKTTTVLDYFLATTAQIDPQGGGVNIAEVIDDDGSGGGSGGGGDALDGLGSLREFAEQLNLQHAPGVYYKWVTFLEAVMSRDKLRIMDILRRLDQNRNGFVTRQEMHEGLTRLGGDFAPEDVHVLMNFLDTDGKNQLDFDDLARHLRYRAKARRVVAAHPSLVVSRRVTGQAPQGAGTTGPLGDDTMQDSHVQATNVTQWERNDQPSFRAAEYRSILSQDRTRFGDEESFDAPRDPRLALLQQRQQEQQQQQRRQQRRRRAGDAESRRGGPESGGAARDGGRMHEDDRDILSAAHQEFSHLADTVARDTASASRLVERDDELGRLASSFLSGGDDGLTTSQVLRDLETSDELSGGPPQGALGTTHRPSARNDQEPFYDEGDEMGEEQERRYERDGAGARASGAHPHHQRGEQSARGKGTQVRFSDESMMSGRPAPGGVERSQSGMTAPGVSPGSSTAQLSREQQQQIIEQLYRSMQQQQDHDGQQHQQTVGSGGGGGGASGSMGASHPGGGFDSLSLSQAQMRLSLAEQEAAHIRSMAEEERRRIVDEARSAADRILSQAREREDRERADRAERSMAEGDATRAKLALEAEKMRAQAEADALAIRREAQAEAQQVRERAREEAAAAQEEADKAARAVRDKARREVEQQRAEQERELEEARRAHKAKLEQEERAAGERADDKVAEAKREAERMRKAAEHEAEAARQRASSVAKAAEEEAEQSKANAVQEVRQMLRDARSEADKLRQEAVEQGTREGEERRRALQADVDALEQEKQRLEAQVSRLRDEVAALESELQQRRQEAMKQLEEELATRRRAAEEEVERKEAALRDLEEATEKRVKELRRDAEKEAEDVRGAAKQDADKTRQQARERMAQEEREAREQMDERRAAMEEDLRKLKARLEDDRHKALAEMEEGLESERARFRKRLAEQKEREEAALREELERLRERTEEEIAQLERTSKRALAQSEEGRVAVSVHEETRAARRDRDAAVRARQVAEARASELEDVVEDLKQDNDRLVGSVHRLQQELEDERAATQQARAEEEQAQRQRRQLEEAYERLQVSVQEQEQQARIDAQRHQQDSQELERLETELQQARRNGALYEEAAKDLELQLQEARAMLQSDQTRLVADQRTETQLQQELQELTRINSALKQKAITLEEDGERLQAEVQERDRQLQEAHSATAARERDVRELEQKVRRLGQEISDAQQALTRAEGHAQAKEEAHQRALARQETLEHELSEAQAKLSTESGEASRLAQQVKRLKAELEEASAQREADKAKAREDVESVRERVSELQEKLKQSRDSLAKVQQARDDALGVVSGDRENYAQLRREMHTLQAESAEWKERAQSLQREVNRLTKRGGAAGGGDQLGASLLRSTATAQERRRLEELSREVERLQRREEELLADNRRLMRTEKEARERAREVEQQQAQGNASHHDTVTRLHKAEDEVRVLRQETTQLQHRLEARTTELNTAQRTVEELRETVRVVRRSNPHAGTNGASHLGQSNRGGGGGGGGVNGGAGMEEYETIARLTAQLQAHESHLLKAREQHAQALTKLEDLEKEHQAKEQRVQELNERMQRLVQEAEESARRAREEREAAQRRGEEGGGQGAQAQADTEALLKRLEEMATLKDTLTQELQMTYSSYEQLRTIVMEQKATMEALRHQLREKEQDVHYERERGDNLLRMWDTTTGPAAREKEKQKRQQESQQDGSNSMIEELQRQLRALQQDKRVLEDELTRLHEAADGSLRSRTHQRTLERELEQERRLRHRAERANEELGSVVDAQTRRYLSGRGTHEPAPTSASRVGAGSNPYSPHHTLRDTQARGGPRLGEGEEEEAAGNGEPTSRLGLSDLDVVVEH